MTYVIWTMEEELALCEAIAARWREAGYTEVSAENYREVMATAAAGGAWRARTLKPAQARRFIELRWSTLALELTVKQPTRYEVPGYEARLSVEEMQAEIVRLNEKIKALTAPKVQPTAPATTKPVETCDGIYRPKELAPKKRVAIAGLHDKHRDNIARRFAHFDIKWIEQGDNDAQIKSKASGRTTIVCTYGTNGNVIKLLRNISTCHQVGGASGVRDILANM